MSQGSQTKPVEMLENGFGEETVIYRVGAKMMFITMREEGGIDNVFVTTISDKYVEDTKTRRGYLYPASFETDEKTGKFAQVSREDEKALINQLVQDEHTGVEYREKNRLKPINQRIVGQYFSAEGHNVFENPIHPNKLPKRRKDKRLDRTVAR